jgi:antitoxin component YwqK of YwqJK toxin-antitoxin module
MGAKSVKPALAKNIQDYICADLVKYVISDYIDIDNLMCLQPNYNLKNRIITSTIVTTNDTNTTNFWDIDKFYKQINVTTDETEILIPIKNGYKIKTYTNKELTTVSRIDEKGLLYGYKYIYKSPKILYKKETYKNGYLDGPTIFYYNNKTVHKIINYKDDLKNGLTIIYYNNKTVHKMINYSNGLKDGWTTYYDNNGNIFQQILYKNSVVIQRIGDTINMNDVYIPPPKK